MNLATTRAIERSPDHLYTLVTGDERLGPFPGATAICRLQDSLGSSDGLMNWAIGLALDEVAAHDPIEGWERVRSAAFAAKDGPRNLGIAVHAAVDQLNRGGYSGVDRMNYETAPYVAQYGAALFQKGIQVLASERYAVNAAIGFGGTYDSLVEINGERGPLDVKTGKEKPSMRLQLTGLSMCDWHAEAGMEAQRMPELDDVGWILLLRPDGYDLVRHEISKADRDHFVHLVGTYHKIREWAATFTPTALKEVAA